MRPIPLALALVAIVAGYVWWQRLPVGAPEAPGSAPVALAADRHAKGSAAAPVVIEEWGDFG